MKFGLAIINFSLMLGKHANFYEKRLLVKPCYLYANLLLLQEGNTVEYILAEQVGLISNLFKILLYIIRLDGKEILILSVVSTKRKTMQDAFFFCFREDKIHMRRRKKKDKDKISIQIPDQAHN